MMNTLQKDNPISTQNVREASIGRILLESGKITPEHAERILRFQKEKGVRFGEAAQSLGLVSEADIQQVLARQFDYAYLQPNQTKYPAELVAAYQPFSPQVEVLRAIRSQLMLRWFALGNKSLVIAGIESKGGSSLFLSNLAIVFSQLGEKTLVVDANLRRPSQHTTFNIKNKLGLSDVIAGRAGLEAIEKVEGFSNLFVLQAGTPVPNPQEIVSRTELKDLLNNLHSQFDVVLLDVPAFSVGADALTVASNVGGVVMVARKHETRLENINNINELLAFTKAQIVGSVLLDF
ncbi:MAG: chain length determinant protein tyrosine kinase EpsG [Pseudomonadota bacterium]